MVATRKFLMCAYGWDSLRDIVVVHTDLYGSPGLAGRGRDADGAIIILGLILWVVWFRCLVLNRNATGAVQTINAPNMALQRTNHPIVSFDQVIAPC